MTVLEIMNQPGWDAGYYTGTVITGLCVLIALYIGRK